MPITLPNANDAGYYVGGGDHGLYQFLTLEEIVETFIATYVGDGKICQNVHPNDVYFHATRAFQELSYDTLRSVKTQELEVPNTLSMLMPRDYVGHVKLSWSDTAGVEHVIYPARVTSNPTDIGYDAATDTYSFTANVLDSDETSDTLSKYQSQTPTQNVTSHDDETLKDVFGSRYGIDPAHAQINGSYFIDTILGKIYFSSNLAGKTLILEYISDGLGYSADSDSITHGAAIIHKFAEEACYKHIAYGCLSALTSTDGGRLALIKKERFAETRKAKIRLSNIKIEEITQILRGSSKIIKH
tara:strand:+ start:7834 stop:8736 length:903 start_codon:yes stop_codon:yes gene_type:complete